MGYKFRKQVSLASVSPYNLFFSCKPKLFTLICQDLMVVYNLEDPNVWMHTCDKKTNLFKEVMLMAFHNLVIIQHKKMMRYALIHEGRH